MQKFFQIFTLLVLALCAGTVQAQNETKCGPPGLTGAPTKSFMSQVIVAGAVHQKIASFTLFSDHTEARDVYA